MKTQTKLFTLCTLLLTIALIACRDQKKVNAKTPATTKEQPKNEVIQEIEADTIYQDNDNDEEYIDDSNEN